MPGIHTPLMNICVLCFFFFFSLFCFCVQLRSHSYDDPKRIESGYFAFKKQIQFGKLFCHYLGCFGKHKGSPIATKYKQMNKDINPLFYEYDECKNIRCVTSNIDNATAVMRYLSEICVRLIEDKQPISDDLLVVCYDFCKDYDYQQAKRMRTVLKNTIIECLSDDIDLRSKEWFQRYIMQSNVLLLDKAIRGEKRKRSERRISAVNSFDLSQFQANNNYNNNNNNNNMTAPPVATTRGGASAAKANAEAEAKTVPANNVLELDNRKTITNTTTTTTQTTTTATPFAMGMLRHDSSTAVSYDNDGNAVLDHFINRTKPFVQNKLIYGFFVEKMNETKEKASQFIEKMCKSIQNDNKMNHYWTKLLSYECDACIDMMTDMRDLRQDRIDQIKGIKNKIPKIKSITPDMSELSLKKFLTTVGQAADTVELLEVCSNTSLLPFESVLLLHGLIFSFCCFCCFCCFCIL